MFTKWNHKIVFLIAAIILTAGTLMAGQKSPDDVWDQTDKAQLQQPGIDNTAMPTAYETFRLNKTALEALLKSAPEEYSGGEAIILSLPMPDGSFSRFEIEHSLVVEAGLLTNYPQLGATYRAHGIDDPTATARFDFLPSGFHSMILSTSGTVIVDPYAKGDTDNYISYFKNDRPFTGKFECEVKGDDGFDSITKLAKADSSGFLPDASAPEVMSGAQLRTYRLALAADWEYCNAVGGNTVAGCLAAQVLIMNRVNGVYEKDVAIHMNIIANNNLIVFAGDNLGCGGVACTSANDPYTDSDGSAMLGQNQSTIDSRIGSANYDIGHVFSTGAGGVAYLGVVCGGGSKAGGVTGIPNPIGDDFAIDYVAHEMGHQWGALHTFNGTTGFCGSGGQRDPGSAYETGSGITIMAYAGICDNQDLALHSIDTFHVKSLEVITAYSQTGGGNSCAVTTASGNTPPTVTGPGNFNIPKMTAFALTATASDVNPGDSITYDWQEYDLGAATTAVPNTDATGIKPIFRPYLPTASGTRFFPSLQYIRNNANVPPSTFTCGASHGGPCLTGELLPTVTRTMTFQVVARDNHAATGGINTATSFVSVDGNSGPFVMTAPNTAVSFAGNTFQTVTWNVANTTNAPVNAANVKISLSTDGGQTFPNVILASTANDGTEDVLIPNTPTTTARIKVEAVGNIFFDISNTNFTVTAGATGTPTPTATSTGSSTPTATATATPTCAPNTWRSGPAQPPARYAIQGALGTDNKLYIAGGQNGDATIVYPNVSRYDYTTNTWSDVAPLPVALGQGAAGAWNGKIYVAGGFIGGTSVTNALRIYDIATNTWTSGANMPNAGLEAAAAAVVNGKFYVMGGDDFTNGVNTNYIYDIATNTWTTGATVPDARTNTYGTAFNGLIYVYGGVNIVSGAFVTTDTLLRYNPATNTWTNLGSAGTAGARGNYGAISPLGSGQLLITDGANASGVSTTATHIFTISSGTFSAGPAMITARAGHAQGTMPDGRVLVADGFDTASTVTSAVELFTGSCTSGTPTNTPTASATNTATATPTSTPTNTPTVTATSTPTGTPSGSPSPTPVGTFANNAAICTTLGGPGSPYPSTIMVAGGPTQIDTLRVTLINLVHQSPDNMDFLLVGPNGAKFILMADAGGALPLATPGVTLTFSDAAGQVLPDSGPLTTGTFEPTSWEPGQTSFAAPAPPAPYNEPGSAVGGTGTQTLVGNFRLANSNGAWNLYMRDDAGLFSAPTAINGCVNGGWQIQFIPTTAASLGISGRVTTASGNGIRNARIVLTGNSLSEPRVTQTGSFGYYTFDGLQAGETYVITVNSRRYTFSMPSRVISLVDNVIDADFTADPQE